MLNPASFDTIYQEYLETPLAKASPRIRDSLKTIIPTIISIHFNNVITLNYYAMIRSESEDEQDELKAGESWE